LDRWRGPGNHAIDSEARAAYEDLRMIALKQSGVGLWSLGPRYAFVEDGAVTVIDLQAIPFILRNAFFGVRVSDEKGRRFEDQFRAFASAQGLDLLPTRVLRVAPEVEREVDAAFRVGPRLFLCECRSMEQPLDLEISKPRSVFLRNTELQQKVDQARSLAELVMATPTGLNYDFSWADEVVHLVVSPFREWIWSNAADLWLDSQTPRILSAREAVQYMKSGSLHLG
jgi:hypothetical protein